MPLRISLQFTNPALQHSSRPYSQVASWIFEILYILLSLGFGVALLSLPWLSFWENNDLLYIIPQLRPMISNSYFKGAVFGLGIADILIAIREIALLGKSGR
jgi:hypothetical protein